MKCEQVANCFKDLTEMRLVEHWALMNTCRTMLMNEVIYEYFSVLLKIKNMSFTFITDNHH